MPPLARERLARLLAASHPDLLLEWLGIVAGTDYRVPPETLPLLPKPLAARPPCGVRSSRRRAGRGVARAAESRLGLPRGARRRRVRDVWQYGSLAQRRRWLAAKLAEDPAAAREALATILEERAGGRPVGLPRRSRRAPPGRRRTFLDAALSDRARRRPRTGRRTARPAARHPLRPADGRAAAAAGPPAGPGPRSVRAPGDRGEGTVRLRTLAAAAPLAFWTEFGPPAEVVRMTVEGCPPGVLRDSWATAALRQRDETWAQALIGADPGGRTTPPLLGVLSPGSQAATVGHLIGRLPVESFARLVHELPRPWTKELGTALLDWIARQDDHRLVSHAAVVIARAVPPACLRHPLATTRLGMDAGPWRRALTETLNFRREMYEELA